MTSLAPGPRARRKLAFVILAASLVAVTAGLSVLHGDWWAGPLVVVLLPVSFGAVLALIWAFIEITERPGQ